MRKSRKIKKSKRNTKRMKGGISNYNFSALYTIAKERSKIMFDMRRLNEEITRINGKRTSYNQENPKTPMKLIVLTDEHWGELIAKAYEDGIQFYFDNSELGQRLNRKFTFPTYKGYFSRETLKKLYLFVSANAKKSIPMKEMMDSVDTLNKTKSPPHVLSAKDWCELIAECYNRDRIYFIFDESEKGQAFSGIFDYKYLDLYFDYLGKIVDDPPRAPRSSTRYAPESPPRSLDVQAPPPPRKPPIAELMQSPPYEPIQSPPRTRLPPPVSTVEPSAPSIPVVPRGAEEPSIQASLSSLLRRTLSLSQSEQGHENTCFAHSAAVVIFHNVYDLPLLDWKMYNANNCNSYLDTTKPLPMYEEIQQRCGTIGAKRIVLFRYIYEVIVKEYGCNRGPHIEPLDFYLKQPFNPKIFPTLNKILMPLHAGVTYSDFAVSSINMVVYSKTYKPYLEEYLKLYYATIDTEKPRHAIVITEQDGDGYLGKDSMYGIRFHLPFSEFHSNGVIKLEKSETEKKTLEGINYIGFLYNTKTPFSAGFKRLLKVTRI